MRLEIKTDTEIFSFVFQLAKSARAVLSVASSQYSGTQMAHGGPASVLIAFVLIGMMMYCTVHALGEMAVLFPVAGSFSAYSTRFLDPAWGFAMGWK